MPWQVIEFQDATGDLMVARVPQEGLALSLTVVDTAGYLSLVIETVCPAYTARDRDRLR